MRTRSSSEEDYVQHASHGKRNRSVNDRHSAKYKRKLKAIQSKQKRSKLPPNSSDETTSLERYERSKEKRREQENRNPNSSQGFLDRQQLAQMILKGSNSIQIVQSDKSAGFQLKIMATENAQSDDDTTDNEKSLKKSSHHHVPKTSNHSRRKNEVLMENPK